MRSLSFWRIDYAPPVAKCDFTLDLDLNPGTFHGTLVDETEPAQIDKVHDINTENDLVDYYNGQTKMRNDTHCTLELIAAAFVAEHGNYTQLEYDDLLHEY